MVVEFQADEIKKLRHTKIGSINYTEFGKIAEVYTHGEWLTLVSEFGKHISMKKIYWQWGRVYQFAEMFKEKEIPVVYETGSTGDLDYFRDLIPDYDRFQYSEWGIFNNIPEDIGDKGKKALIKERIRYQELAWRNKLGQQENDALKAQVERMSAAEVEAMNEAALILAKRFGHEIPRNESMRVGINGMYVDKKAKYPKKIDITAAMRLGLDVTKQSLINVTPVELVPGTNRLTCRLTDFGDQTAEVAIVPSKRKGRKGHWDAASFVNSYVGWFGVEDTKKYRNAKNKSGQPIEYFLQLHDEMKHEVLFGS